MKKINIYNDLRSRAEISASTHTSPPIITEVLNKTVETENAISTEDKECQTDKATEETGYKKKKAGLKAKGNIQEV